MEYMVKEGVTIEEVTQARKQRRKYPYETMDVGASFFVPDLTTANFATYTHKVAKKIGRRFRTQMTHMRQDADTSTWVPCRLGAPGCRTGVAVTRLA